MKKTTLLILLLMASIFGGSANTGEPDFAFPKTVEGDARAALARASKKGDGPAALQALLQLYTASTLIDDESIPATVATVQAERERFASSPLAGVFDLLLARIYVDYIEANYNITRRETPLEPLPDDLSEWSGRQVCMVADSLCRRALGSADALARIKLQGCSEFVTLDSELTTLYFPTLLDFACLTAARIYQEMPLRCADFSIAERKAGIVATAQSRAAAGSASAVLWEYEKYHLAETRPQMKDARAIMERYADNPAAGLLLARWGGGGSSGSGIEPYDDGEIIVAEDDDYEVETDDGEATGPDAERLSRQADARYWVAAIDRYLRRFPNTPFLSEIESHRASYLHKSVELSLPNYCSPGQRVEVRITNDNVERLTLSLYRLDGTQRRDMDILELKRYARSHTPVQTVVVDHAQQAPFYRTDTAVFTVPSFGEYVIDAVYEGEPDYLLESRTRKGQRWYPRIPVMKCYTAYPVILDNAQNPTVAVADPVTGMPLAGVKVWVKNIGGKDVTDAQGLARVAATSKYNDVLVVERDGHRNEFGQGMTPSPYRDYTDSTTQYTAQVVTDRALYHPGDTLHMLAIVTAGRQSTREVSLRQGLKVGLRLRNANYQIVSEQEGTSDAYGRVTASFALPADGLTGRYRVEVTHGNNRQIGSADVTVSDYKLPDFYIDLDEAARDVPSAGCVTITGRAVTYSGMPLAGTTVTITVKGSPLWSLASVDINSTDVTTGSDGRFTAVLDKDFFHTDNPQRIVWYLAQAEAVSPSGTPATSSVGFSLGKQYVIEVSAPSNVDALAPFRPAVKARGYNGEAADFAMTWTISESKGWNDPTPADGRKPVASGAWDGKPIDLCKVTPGRYKITVAPADTTLADPAIAYFALYNTDTDIVPTDDSLWLPVSDIDIKPGNAPEILFGTTADTTCVFIVMRSGADAYSVRTLTVPRGYHRYRVEGIEEGIAQTQLSLFCVKDWQLSLCSVRMNQRKDTRLEIKCETFRDRLTPMSSETWKFTVLGPDGCAAASAMALDMYNKALDALRPYSQRISFPSFPQYRFVTIRNINLGRKTIDFDGATYLPLGKPVGAFDPQFRYISMVSGHSVYEYSARAMGAPMLMKSLATNEVMVEECAEECEMEPMADSADTGSAEPKVVIRGLGTTPVMEEPKAAEADYRESDMALALWEPMLTTDAEGRLSYTFTVPNAVTTWVLRGVAWDKALDTGSISHEFVASKPVMVQPNMPRFMRSGDRLVIRTLVLNNTDADATATVVIETFNPADGRVLSTASYTVEMAAMQTQTVRYEMDAPADLPAVGIRVRATSGLFTDGEQSVIRVLPNEAALVETTPFYLNPGEKEYSQKLPKGHDMRLTLTFCENPAWTVVSALPGLREQIDEYSNSAAAAIFSALAAKGIVQGNPELASTLRQWRDCPTDSALVSMLDKNADLKVSLLTATPWVQAAESENERMARLSLIFDDKEIASAVKEGKKILRKLQKSDGGWAWGDWCDESSLWVTENVLSMWYDLRSYGYWPGDDRELADMTARALRYLDSKVEHTDLLYTIIRRTFSEVPVSANGKQVIKNTLAEIKKDWKQYTSVSYKAMAALAAWNNGESSLARGMMQSVSEFGVWTKSQGLKFPSVSALSAYACVLEAYARINPGAPEVDGLRQQLIVRKQATDWGSAVVTTEVVSSILSSGTDWAVAAEGATVSVDGHEIKADSPIEHATGQLRADLSAYAGKKLEISTTGTGPAYGAVFAQYTGKMTDVKAASIDDLSVEKTLLVRRGDEWQHATDLRVGDRVKVQLTIRSRRHMQYVEVIDERPAAFEPVQQLPGWTYCDGAAFYRENRDAYTALHVVSLQPGTYLLTYEMNVNTAGTYSSGVATVQSQYAPELTAHSAGTTLVVND